MKAAFQKRHYTALTCKSNIEMTPLCKIEVTRLRMLGPGRCTVAVFVDEMQSKSGFFVWRSER